MIPLSTGLPVLYYFCLLDYLEYSVSLWYHVHKVYWFKILLYCWKKEWIRLKRFAIPDQLWARSLVTGDPKTATFLLLQPDVFLTGSGTSTFAWEYEGMTVPDEEQRAALRMAYECVSEVYAARREAVCFFSNSQFIIHQSRKKCKQAYIKISSSINQYIFKIFQTFFWCLLSQCRQTPRKTFTSF